MNWQDIKLGTEYFYVYPEKEIIRSFIITSASKDRCSFRYIGQDHALKCYSFEYHANKNFYDFLYDNIDDARIALRAIENYKKYLKTADVKRKESNDLQNLCYCKIVYFINTDEPEICVDTLLIIFPSNESIEDNNCNIFKLSGDGSYKRIIDKKYSEIKPFVFEDVDMAIGIKDEYIKMMKNANAIKELCKDSKSSINVEKLLVSLIRL